MLVLSRKPGEKVVISNNITVTVLEVVGNRVRIGIEAPEDVRILRGELACWLDATPQETKRPERRTATAGRVASDRPLVLAAH